MPELVSINPFNEERIAFHPVETTRTIDLKLKKSSRASDILCKMNLDTRRDLVYALARRLRKKIDIYSELITIEMGKPISEARSELEKCIFLCNYYVENVGEALADDQIISSAGKSYVTYKPLGSILGIMPWNFPFWQVFRFAIPAFLAGNAILLKHASNVQMCAKAMEELFSKSGFPEGAFTNLCLPSSEVAKVIDHHVVAALSLTGSEGAGSAVASQAGSLIKKTVLELGGNDAYLILNDADVDLAVEQTILSRMVNAGQSCIGAKRIIVHRDAHDDFISNLKMGLKKFVPSNPLDEDCLLGPMAKLELKEELILQVNMSIDKGAILTQEGLEKHKGTCFYPPAILEDVRPGMPAFDDELFGPVFSIIKANSEEEMIALANISKFGLGAAIFSRNVQRAEQIARDQLEAGSCFVNAFVRSDPRLPFGGIKKSGYGREMSFIGLKEFANIKTVWV